MARRHIGPWGIATVILVGLGLVRLMDAFGKTGLQSGLAASGGEERERVTLRDSLSTARKTLALDEQFLRRRLASIAGGQPYLIITRSEQKLELALGEKVVLETNYRMSGPMQDGLARLPAGTLEVLAVTTNTDWYRPDWVYEKKNEIPPRDSSSRTVRAAFGAGEVFLGGDIVIHGRVREAVAPEAVDHGYIELDDGALRSVVSAMKKGSTVLIH
jgi:hypothetical protein